MFSVSTFWIGVGTAYGLQILIKLMTGRLHFLCWFYVSKKKNVYLALHVFYFFLDCFRMPIVASNRRFSDFDFYSPFMKFHYTYFFVIVWQSSTWGQFSFSSILFFRTSKHEIFQLLFLNVRNHKIFFKVLLNFINNRKMFACIFHHSFYSCADYYKKSCREKWNKKWNGDMAIEKEAKSSFY